MKKFLAILIMTLAMAMGLCGCQESANAKISRLEKEAEAARSYADEKRSELKYLESALGK